MISKVLNLTNFDTRKTWLNGIDCATVDSGLKAVGRCRLCHVTTNMLFSPVKRVVRNNQRHENNLLFLLPLAAVTSQGCAIIGYHV